MIIVGLAGFHLGFFFDGEASLIPMQSLFFLHTGRSASCSVHAFLQIRASIVGIGFHLNLGGSSV